MTAALPSDAPAFMRRALRLARRGYGNVSPNPMVGAVLTRGQRILGQGWHRQAGAPHAEIEAIEDARRRNQPVHGATLFVTLEPCSTHGRTPPCTEGLIREGIRRVVVAATDPNPNHAGAGLTLLRRAGLEVQAGLLAEEAGELNAVFNHWIVHRTPWVLVKAALSLDGKIATATGESKWITSAPSRRWTMRLRQGADAILTGVRTILADDPALTVRLSRADPAQVLKCPRRFILDTTGRIPLSARVLTDAWRGQTTVIVGETAPPARVAFLRQRVQVWTAPLHSGRIDVQWAVQEMGREGLTSLMVEGGGEINSSFLFANCCHRIAFFYAPKILGGSASLKAVAGAGASSLDQSLRLVRPRWRQLGEDWLLRADLHPGPGSGLS